MSTLVQSCLSPCAGRRLSRATLVFLLLSAQVPDVLGRSISMQCDGTIRKIEGNTAYVEWPSRAIVVDPGMKVGTYDVLDIFTKSAGDDKAIVAEIDVPAVSKVEEIQREFITFKVDDVSGRKMDVSVDRPVLISSTLRAGKQYVVLDDPRSAKLAFVEYFSEGTKLGTFWETMPGGAWIQDGKLIVDRFSLKLKDVQAPTTAALTVKVKGVGFESRYKFNDVAFTMCPVGIEFDTEARKGFKLALDVGGYNNSLIPVEYVIEKYDKMSAGIYHKGALAARLPGGGSPLKSKHVFIKIASTYAELIVDQRRCRLELKENYIKAGYRNIVLFCEGRCTIDNFKLWWLPMTESPKDRLPQVMGVSVKGDKVLVARGTGWEWQGSLVGQTVSLSGSGSPVTTEIVGEAQDMLICKLDKDSPLSIPQDAVVSIKRVARPARPSTPAEPTRVAATEQPESKKAIPIVSQSYKEEIKIPNLTASAEAILDELTQDGKERLKLAPLTPASSVDKTGFLLARLQDSGKDSLTVRLVRTGTAPKVGCVYPVVETLSHPLTGCALGVRLGKPVQCTLEQSGDQVTAKADKGAAFSPEELEKRFVAISSLRFQQENMCLELIGKAYSCDFSLTRQTFWNVAGGQWKTKLGRFYSSSPADKDGVPMLVSARTVQGNIQLDYDIIVEKPISQIFCTYTKDISTMFYSPSTKAGLTVGLGAEGYGGVSFDRGMPGAVNARAFMEYNKLKDGGGWGGHGEYIGGQLEAKLKKNYRLKVRRIGDTFMLFINNRRVALAAYPGITGELQTWLIFPESMVSVDNCSLMELPGNIPYPSDDPSLGEFGYVVSVMEKELFIDSGFAGLEKGGVIRVVKVVKESHSQQTDAALLSADFQCIATGTVVETGHRIARVKLLQASEPIIRGMKIYTQKYADTFKLTRVELADIDKPL